MRNLYILLITLFSATIAIGQTEYSEVLYRVNVGGDATPAGDEFDFEWERDSYDQPAPYHNSAEQKIFTTADPIQSVPEGVPEVIFTSERSIESWDVERQEWSFSVDEGTPVELRLYMAEIFYTEVDERSFDIEVEGEVVESDVDLIEEAGSNTAVVKTYTITSDGSVDFALIQNASQPTISGVEILAIQEDEITAVNQPLAAVEKSVYPNPFTNSIIVPNVSKQEEVVITDMSGHEVLRVSNGAKTQNGLEINTSDLAKGMYILKVNGEAKVIQKQ